MGLAPPDKSDAVACRTHATCGCVIESLVSAKTPSDTAIIQNYFLLFFFFFHFCVVAQFTKFFTASHAAATNPTNSAIYSTALTKIQASHAHYKSSGGKDHLAKYIKARLQKTITSTLHCTLPASQVPSHTHFLQLRFRHLGFEPHHFHHYLTTWTRHLKATSHLLPPRILASSIRSWHHGWPTEHRCGRSAVCPICRAPGSLDNTKPALSTSSSAHRLQELSPKTTCQRRISCESALPMRPPCCNTANVSNRLNTQPFI